LEQLKLVYCVSDLSSILEVTIDGEVFEVERKYHLTALQISALVTGILAIWQSDVFHDRAILEALELAATIA
jgi:hypothetical protein